MESLQKGASYPAATDGDVRAQEIPVPPLAEQQRNVGLLDEAFKGLATAKANAEKNLQNARALFESHVQSVFTQGSQSAAGGRGPGWVEKSLGETCEMYQPKTIGTKDLGPDGPYPVFGANGVIGRYDKFNHEEPQLLVTCRGATCGSVNISEPNSWITGNAMVVRPEDCSASGYSLKTDAVFFSMMAAVIPYSPGQAWCKIDSCFLRPLRGVPSLRCNLPFRRPSL